jgi:hypothetical protein
MRFRSIVAPLACALCASAFAASPTAGSDAGPFPPRADPVLNGPAPRVFQAAPANGTMAAEQPLDAATIAELQRDADAKRLETARAEAALDRTDRLARDEQLRAAMTPPPVAPGAWNGETDPRTR